MVQVVGGLGLGLLDSSLALLGGRGAVGSGKLGRDGTGISVNAATGNLVVQRRDELLVTAGADINILRTYNSQGALDGDNNDGWRLGLVQNLMLTGSANAIGSSVVRTAADGSTFTYAWNGTAYTCAESGAELDTLGYNTGTAQWTWTDGASQTKQVYDASGKLIQLVNRSGNTINLGYSGNLLTSITSTRLIGTTGQYEGTYIDYVVGTSDVSQIRTVTDNGAGSAQTLTRVRYTYDAQHRLSTVTTDLSPGDNTVADLNTLVTAYTYEGTSTRVASITQKSGAVGALVMGQVSFVYDASGRLVSATETGPAGTSFTTGFSYDSATQTTVTDPLGLKTILSFDANQRLMQMQGPDLRTTKFGYQAGSNRVATVTDGAGSTITYGYDIQGNRNLEVDAAGNTITRTFSAADQLLTETVYAVRDPDGAAGPLVASGAQTTRYVYDSNNRLVYEIDPEGLMTRYEYNALGQQTAELSFGKSQFSLAGLAAATSLTQAQLDAWYAAITDKSQVSRTDYQYDWRGQLSRSTRYSAMPTTGVVDPSLAAAMVVDYSYDAAGQLISTTDFRGPSTSATRYTTSNTYDGLGRVLASTNAVGQSTFNLYDDANNRIVTTVLKDYASASNTGTIVSAVNVSVYDGAGRLVGMQHRDLSAAAAGSPLNAATLTGGALIDSVRNVFDGDGRLVATVDAVGNLSRNIYDLAGRRIAEIDPTGAVTEYTYDGADRVVKTTRYANKVAPTYAQDFSANLNGLLEQDTTNQINLDTVSGRLAFSSMALPAGSVSSYPKAYLAASYAFSQAPHLKLEVTTDANGGLTTASPNQNFEVRLSNGGAGTLYRKHSVSIWGSSLVVSGINTAGVEQPTTLTTSVKASTTYVIEIVIDSSGSTVYVYEKGKSRADGWIDHRDATDWGTADLKMSTAAAATFTAPATAWVDNLSLTLSPWLPTADATKDLVSRSIYNAAGQEIYTVDSQNYVSENVYDGAGRLLRKTDYARAIAPPTNWDPASVRAALVALGPSGNGTPTNSAGTPTASWYDDGYGLTYHPYWWNDYDRSTRYFYDASGRNTGILDSENGLTEYRYDAAGRLVESVRYPGPVMPDDLTSVVDYQLDPSVTLATLKAVIGQAYAGAGVGYWPTYAKSFGSPAHTYFIYDAAGRQTGTVDAEGYLDETVYDASGNATQRIRYASKVAPTTGLVWDNGSPNLAAVSAAATAVGSAASGLTIGTVRGALVFNAAVDQRVVSTFDGSGRLMSDTDSGDGTVTQYGYDAVGNLIQKVRATNIAAAFQRSDWLRYDAMGRVTAALSAEGGEQLRVVMSTVVGTGGYATQAAKDAAAATVWNNYAVSYAYDARGLKVSAESPDGKGLDSTVAGGRNTTWLYYDDAGRLTYTVNALGEVKRTSFNNLGQIAEERKVLTRISTAGLSGGADKLIAPAVNAVVNNGLDAVTTYAYDNVGNMVLTVDPAGYATKNTFDAFHEVIGSSHQVQVDLVTPTNTRWVDTAYKYDLLGRLGRTRVDALPVAHGADPATGVGAGYSMPLLGTRNDYSYFNSLGQLVASERYDNGVWATKDVTTVATYDRLGRQMSVTPDWSDPRLLPVANYTQRTTDDAFGRVLTQTDRTGAVTRYVYAVDATSGNHTMTVTSPEGVTTTTVTNRFGEKVSVTTSGGTWIYNYNKDGKLLSTQSPVNTSSAVASKWYDTAGHLVSETDELGVKTRYTYDAINRVLTRVIDAGTGVNPITGQAYLNLTTQNLYRASSRELWSRDAGGTWTKTTYDKLGHIISVVVDPTTAVTDPSAVSYTGLNLTSLSTYDGHGNVLTVTEAAGSPAARVTQYVYDSQGQRIKTIVDPAGLKINTSYVYDGAGNVALITEAEGTAAERRTLNLYDDQNNLTWSVDGMGAVTRYEYDTEGRLGRTTRYANQITNPINVNLTEFDLLTALKPNDVADEISYNFYDKDGRLIRQVDALGAVTEVRYHANSNFKASTVERAGLLTATQLAALAKLRFTPAVATPGAAAPIAYETSPGVYAAFGDAADANLQAVASADDRTTYFAYDAAGRQVAQVDAEGYLTENEYNAASALTATTRYALKALSPATAFAAATNGVVNLALLRPNQVTDTANARTRYQYDAAGRRTVMTDAMGYTTTSVYDAAGRVLKSVRTDVNLNTSVESTTKYDTAGRAIGQIDGEGYVTKSVLDSGGNVLQKIQYANATTARDAANWQPAGNAADRTTTYAYDANWRLTDETTPPVAIAGVATQTITTHYIYDGTGHRTQMTEAYGRSEAKTTSYFYNARGDLNRTQFPLITLYAELATGLGQVNSGTALPETTSVYNAFGNEVVSKNAAGYFSYKVYDKLNQLRYEVDQGNYVTQYDRDAFGQVTKVTRYLSPVSWQLTIPGYWSPQGYWVDSGQFDANGTMIQVWVSTGPDVWVNPVLGVPPGWVAGNPIPIDSLESLLSRQLILTSTDNRSVATRYDHLGHSIKALESDAYFYDTTGTSWLNGVGTFAGIARRATYSYFDAFGNTLLTQQYLEDTTGAQKTRAQNHAYAYDLLGRKVLETTFMDAAVPNQYGAVDGTNVFDTRYATSDGTGNQNALNLRYAARYQYDAKGNVVQTDEGKLSPNANGTPSLTLATLMALGATGQATGATAAQIATVTTALMADAGLVEYRYVYDRNNRKLSDSLMGETWYTPQSTGGGSLDLTASLKLAKQTGNITTQYRYDAVGNLTATLRADGSASRIFYDGLNRVVGSWSSVASATSGAYTALQLNAFGQVVNSRRHTNAATYVYASDSFTAPATDDPKDQIDQMSYDEYGHLIKHIDAEAHSTYYFYNKAGQRTASLTPYQRVSFAAGTFGPTTQQALRWAYAYDSRGNLQTAAMNDTAKRTVTTLTNAFGEVSYRSTTVTATGAVGSALTRNEYYQYDNVGNLVGTNEKDGVARVYLYGTNGKATSEIRSKTVDLGYFTGASANALAAANKVQTRTGYNQAGQVTWQVLANGAFTEQQVDHWGNVVRVTAPFTTAPTGTAASDAAYNERSTSYVYDKRGNRTEEITPKALTSFAYYDAANTSYRFSSGQAQGHAYTYYDVMGRVAAQKSANAVALSMSTDAAGYVAAANQANLAYDSAGQLGNGYTWKRTGTAAFWYIDPANSTSNYSLNFYDFAGNLTQQHTPGGSASTGFVDSRLYSYDSFGRKTKSDAGALYNAPTRAAHLEYYQYDRLNNLTKRWDQYGYETTTYDDVGHRTSTTRQISALEFATTRYALDGEGHVLTQYSPMLWNWTAYTYDGWGNKLSEQSFGMGQSSTRKEVAGMGGTTSSPFEETTTVRDAAQTVGSVASWNYDGFSRVVQHLSLGGATTNYYYANSLKLLTSTATRSATENIASEAYTYDNFGRLSALETATRNTAGVDTFIRRREAYEYDASDRRTRETAQISGGVTELAAPLDWVQQANVNNYQRDARISYDPLGRITSIADYLSTTPTEWINYWIADATARAAGKALPAAPAPVQSLTNAYDLNGNRINIKLDYTRANGVRAAAGLGQWYAYDLQNRLLLAEATGNSTTMTINVAETDNAAKKFRTYDACGNVSTETIIVSSADKKKTYTYYDNRNRINYQWTDNLKTASLENNDYFYTYDGADRLIWTDRYIKTNYVLNNVDTQDYDLEGKVTSSHSWARGAHSIDYGMSYDAAGNLTQRTTAGSTYHSTVDAGGTGYGYSDTVKYTYQPFETWRLAKQVRTNTSWGNPTTTTSTTLSMDRRGTVLSSNNNGSVVSYSTDADGHIIKKGANRYFFANGVMVASNANSLNDAIRYDYSRANVAEQGGAPGDYLVRASDTLYGIAQQVWGDGNLWYLIADANFLADDAELQSLAGQSIVIPNRITSLHNATNTFKPYNEAKILGDLTPKLPPPPAPTQDSGGCGGGILSIIIMVVVLVVVTVVTVGVGSAIAGSAWAASAGLANAATATAAASLTTAGSIVAGAAGAVAGSIVGQGLQIAAGLRDSFSFAEVGIAAVTGAATAGISSGLGAITGGLAKAGLSGATLTVAEYGARMIGGAVGNMLGQGMGIAMGMQKQFNWTDVALAAGKAGIGKGMESLANVAKVGDVSLLKEVGSADFNVSNALANGLRAAAKAGLTNIAEQGLEMAVGKQQAFNWVKVASAAGDAAKNYFFDTEGPRLVKALTESSSTPGFVKDILSVAAPSTSKEPDGFLMETLMKSGKDAAIQTGKAFFGQAQKVYFEGQKAFDWGAVGAAGVGAAVNVTVDRLLDKSKWFEAQNVDDSKLGTKSEIWSKNLWNKVGKAVLGDTVKQGLKYALGAQKTFDLNAVKNALFNTARDTVIGTVNEQFDKIGRDIKSAKTHAEIEELWKTKGGLSPLGLVTNLGEDVDKLATLSTTLSEALKTLKAKNWSIEFGPKGDGTYAMSEQSKIRISEEFKGNTIEVLAALAHEVGHAMDTRVLGHTSKPVYVEDAMTGEGYAEIEKLRVEAEIMKAGGPEIAPNGYHDDMHLSILGKYENDNNVKAAAKEIGNDWRDLHPSAKPDVTYVQYYGDSYDKHYGRGK